MKFIFLFFINIILIKNFNFFIKKKNMNPTSINDSFYKFSSEHIILNKVKSCLNKCSTFDKKEMATKERECIEKCFYNLIENHNMNILK